MLCVDWGCLRASVSSMLERAGVRDAIVAAKPVKAGGAKGVRKLEFVMSSDSITKSVGVLIAATLTGEIQMEAPGPSLLPEWIERRVWTERMVASLLKGGARRWAMVQPARQGLLQEDVAGFV